VIITKEVKESDNTKIKTKDYVIASILDEFWDFIESSKNLSDSDRELMFSGQLTRMMKKK